MTSVPEFREHDLAVLRLAYRLRKETVPETPQD
jgi:hypothetical protein